MLLGELLGDLIVNEGAQVLEIVHHIQLLAVLRTLLHGDLLRQLGGDLPNEFSRGRLLDRHLLSLDILLGLRSGGRGLLFLAVGGGLSRPGLPLLDVLPGLLAVDTRLVLSLDLEDLDLHLVVLIDGYLGAQVEYIDPALELISELVKEPQVIAVLMGLLLGESGREVVVDLLHGDALLLVAHNEEAVARLVVGFVLHEVGIGRAHV